MREVSTFSPTCTVERRTRPEKLQWQIDSPIVPLRILQEQVAMAEAGESQAPCDWQNPTCAPASLSPLHCL